MGSNIKRNQVQNNYIYFIIFVSTPLFAAETKRKFRNIKYFYYDYLIVIPLHFAGISKWRETQHIMFTANVYYKRPTPCY